ncbi:MAG: hypothetical protein EPO40_16565 [Myxococcaceae bacterium]|nr:MAG: hypothetical protein EPO40_16565 [Myxococcaceae bacterium]
MRPPVACSRRCGATAPDAETALAALWEHLPPSYWLCPACEAGDVCPNCNRPSALLFSTGEIVRPDLPHGGYLGVTHCGCYYEGDPERCDSHFSRDAHLWGYDDTAPDAARAVERGAQVHAAGPT